MLSYNYCFQIRHYFIVVEKQIFCETFCYNTGIFKYRKSSHFFGQNFQLQPSINRSLASLPQQNFGPTGVDILTFGGCKQTTNINIYK